MRTLFPILCVVFVLSALPADSRVLHAGDQVALASSDGAAIALNDSDDPIVRLAETEGRAVVVRLCIGTASHVIALRGFEERRVRLREVFANEELSRSEIGVEVLQGTGAVTVGQTGSEVRTEVASRRRAVASPKARPTSIALIDQAEAAGAIDSETALLYRVYALFADARLPAIYRGDDTEIIDSLYLGEVRQRFASLSPATQAAVTPFLVPPAYKGSWVDGKADAPKASVIGEVVKPCENPVFRDDWRSVDAANSPVRVWYDTNVETDALFANGLVAEVDRIIWSKLTGLMHVPGSATGLPLNDEPEPCNGGNSRLDIYLVDGATSFTIPYEFCPPTPAFITLVRNTDFGVAAHEIFHAIQFSFPATCNPISLKWWAEGSAEWAIDFVYGRDHQIEQGAAYHLLSFPKKPLDALDTLHSYATYLLPFFQYGKSRDASFVRKAWSNLANDAPLDAVDKALPGGFEKVWPEFVRYNWNEKPFDEYDQWDHQFLGARPEEGGPLTIGTGAPAFAISLPVELPGLSSVYHHFKIDDQVSTLAFWNGVTTKLTIGDLTEGTLGPQYVTDPAASADTKGAHVTALIKINGDWKEEDWTDRPVVIYCRDYLADRVEELVLIISNSEFKDSGRTLNAPALDPVVYASNMGCQKWTGTATWTSTDLTTTANVTWKATASSPLGTIYVAEGGLTWRSTVRDCNASGSAPLGFSSLIAYDLLPLENQRGRTYESLGEGPIISVCNSQYNLHWLTTPDSEERLLKVSADGKVMAGSYTIDSGANSWTWRFEAQRE